jgi:hypothetical protein
MIEPSELFRVFPPQPEVEPVRTPPAPECGSRYAPVSESDTPDAPAWEVRTARLEAALAALRKAEADRDRWAAQAGRLALAAPARQRGLWTAGKLSVQLRPVRDHRWTRPPSLRAISR